MFILQIVKQQDCRAQNISRPIIKFQLKKIQNIDTSIIRFQLFLKAETKLGFK